MNNKLYVGNLSFDTTEHDLQEHFAQAGGVREVTLINDKFTGRSRGFGFVVMEDDAAAQSAIEKLNNRGLQGRNLTVNIAREREDRSSGGGRPSGRDRRPARRF